MSQNYDLSVLCSEQLEILHNRLSTINKQYIKQYEMALSILNNKQTNDHREELVTEVENYLSDQANKCAMQYNQTMDKIQKTLMKYL